MTKQERIEEYNRLKNNGLEREIRKICKGYRVKKIGDLGENNWYRISSSPKLSEAFIEKFRDNVWWKLISRYQILSEEFIDKFQDRVDWVEILNYQKLTYEFIERLKIKLIIGEE